MRISETSKSTPEHHCADPNARLLSSKGGGGASFGENVSINEKAKVRRASRDNFDTDFEEMFDNMPV